MLLNFFVAHLFLNINVILKHRLKKILIICLANNAPQLTELLPALPTAAVQRACEQRSTKRYALISIVVKFQRKKITITLIVT